MALFPRNIFFILLIIISFLFSRNISAEPVSVSIIVTTASCGNGIIESGEQCDGYFNLGNANCVSLGYAGGTIGCNNSCQRTTNYCYSVVPQASTTQVINFSNGASYTLTNSNNTNVLFTFPQNFYTENVDFQANSYASDFFASTKPAPSGKDFIGKTYDFSFAKSSSSGQFTTTSEPITISMTYSDSDVSGFDESALAPYRWGSSDSSWQLITGSTLDTANNKITFSTKQFSSFGIFGSSSSGGSSGGSGSSGGGGGGGGGGGPSTPTTGVIIQGIAYPGAEITVLKDGQVITGGIVADYNANFKTTLSTITAGTYTFGVWANDKQGRRSITFSFTVTVTAGMTTTISGIFIPPTIGLEKTGIQKGEILNISGQTAPQSELAIGVESANPINATTAADKFGDWKYSFDTSPLANGVHFAKAKADLNGILSSYSNTLVFYVGKDVAPGKVKTADSNGDSRVNLIDFSILLYNWGTPKNAKADINGDGWVNLVDFSIMMYQWTG